MVYTVRFAFHESDADALDNGYLKVREEVTLYGFVGFRWHYKLKKVDKEEKRKVQQKVNDKKKMFTIF